MGGECDWGHGQCGCNGVVGLESFLCSWCVDRYFGDVAGVDEADGVER